MSIELLELGSSALGELTREVVFVGGATVGLWITDPAAPPPRPTKDVDVIVEVATRAQYHVFEERLRGAGFRDDEGGHLPLAPSQRTDPRRDAHRRRAARL